MNKIITFIVVTVAFLTGVSIAQAGWDAYTTADVNMREGPGNRYRVIVVIPEGEPVHVHGCPGSWCDVEWHAYRGYVFGQYLSSTGSGYYEGYVAPPVIVVPEYDGGYIHVPGKRKHYDRHKRKGKLRRHRSGEHYERPSRPRKQFKRSKRRKSMEQRRERPGIRRSGKRRSMRANPRRNEQRLQRRHRQGQAQGGEHRQRKKRRLHQN